MKRFTLKAALLTALALVAVLASSAQAETAPSFTIQGARLAAGRTHNFDARATANFILTGASGATTITCTKLGTVGGVLLGSNAGTQGSANQVTVFSGCTLVGNGAACHLAPTEGSAETTEVIMTNPIKSELVENVVGTHGGKKLYEAFFPVSKAKGIVKLNFGGTCTVTSSLLSGSIAAEVVLDTAGEGSVELGQLLAERTSWKLRFPSLPINEVWLVSNGVGKVVETGLGGFPLGGEGVILDGTSLVLLASTKYVPEPNTLWSPLP
jgi:hypothetical protein